MKKNLSFVYKGDKGEREIHSSGYLIDMDEPATFIVDWNKKTVEFLPKELTPREFHDTTFEYGDPYGFWRDGVWHEANKNA